MSKFEFVDTHIHLWDLQHPVLYYDWLQPGVAVERLGPRFGELRTFNYLAEDYVAESRNANVTKAVHVQAAVGTKDPVKETEWLQEAAGRTGFPQAIVAYANLKDPKVEELLARHSDYANLRGIRDLQRDRSKDLAEGSYLVDSGFHRGYAMLERFNLIFSIDVRWPDLAKARDLAAKFPNIPMVVDHSGNPDERTDEYFKSWAQGMRTVAEAENVWCKISGLGRADHSWTVDSIRRWVLQCIEAFGTERCFFGTNWPPDSLYSTFDAVIDAYTEIIADFTDDEKVAMFSANAERLYRI